MKLIEIDSCDECQFAYENDRRKLSCGLAKILTENVEEDRVHPDCPLRKGPIQFCLSNQDANSGDVARSKKCRDCGKPFEVTYGELKFLEERFGSDFGEPSRCKPCRKAKKNPGNGNAK